MTKPPPSSTSSAGPSSSAEPPPPRRGYIEGTYGRLLDWPERDILLNALAACGMNTYLYAPKEDIAHRFDWRSDWPPAWWEGFGNFTRTAAERGIEVIGGIAPGLDFDFGSLIRGDGDIKLLEAKAEKMLHGGAGSINLLMDDLDPGLPGLHSHDGGTASEGRAHADLANHLAHHLARISKSPTSITPRIYADEIAAEGDPYLDDFIPHLDDMMVWTCGHHIVSREIDLANTALARGGIALERMIVWDNLYAHDYCPRRLFLGLWSGRGAVRDILLNPTGLVHTDGLLLHLMAAGEDREAWHKVFEDHHVPDAFHAIAHFFDLPPHPTAASPDDMFDDDLFDLGQAEAWLAALDTLLWRWKAPLQREWYPFLMGLRGDILFRMGAVDEGRAEKIFPPLINPNRYNKAKVR